MGGYRNNCPPIPLNSPGRLDCIGYLTEYYRVSLSGIVNDVLSTCGNLNDSFDIPMTVINSTSAQGQLTTTATPILGGTPALEYVRLNFTCSGSDVVVLVTFERSLGGFSNFYRVLWQETLSGVSAPTMNETVSFDSEVESGAGVDLCDASMANPATVVAL